MKAAKAIGLPVPSFLAYGAPSHDDPFGTILMTRVPGFPLDEVKDSLTSTQLDTIQTELRSCLNLMRAYDSPWGCRVCSVIGTSLYGSCLLGGEVKPCGDEVDFHGQFLSARMCRENWDFSAPYDETLAKGSKLLSMRHDIKFTHGDLMPHNIMVFDGHLSGIID